MKTCLLLLAVPCLSSAFQQVSPVTCARRQRLDAAFVPKAAAVEEPPAKSKPSTKDTLVSELPPVLQDIVDERREFQMNLGKAMDTLRKDYPEILRTTPDFSIYHESITVVDPSGVQLTGLSKYKNAILFFQTLVKFLYTQQSGLQYRMVYDFCRSSIRVSWHLKLYPKVIGGPMYVDGISSYRLDPASGKIDEHRIENLLINNSPVAPPYGIFSLLQEEMRPRSVPVGGMCIEAKGDKHKLHA